MKGRRQHLLHIGQEPIPGHRAVEHHGSGHAGHPERPDEGSRLPMPMRHAGTQTLPARCATIEARHLGTGASLVDEDQALRVEIKLAFEPGLPTPQNVGTVLLRRMRGLFLSVIFRRAKKRHSVETATATPRSARSAWSSASVMSGFAATAPRITGE